MLTLLEYSLARTLGLLLSLLVSGLFYSVNIARARPLTLLVRGRVSFAFTSSMGQLSSKVRIQQQE